MAQRAIKTIEINTNQRELIGGLLVLVKYQTHPLELPNNGFVDKHGALASYTNNVSIINKGTTSGCGIRWRNTWGSIADQQRLGNCTNTGNQTVAHPQRPRPPHRHALEHRIDGVTCRDLNIAICTLAEDLRNSPEVSCVWIVKPKPATEVAISKLVKAIPKVDRRSRWPKVTWRFTTSSFGHSIIRQIHAAERRDSSEPRMRRTQMEPTGFPGIYDEPQRPIFFGNEKDASAPIEPNPEPEQSQLFQTHEEALPLGSIGSKRLIPIRPNLLVNFIGTINISSTAKYETLRIPQHLCNFRGSNVHHVMHFKFSVKDLDFFKVVRHHNARRRIVEIMILQKLL
jgi:hypothetical protein